MGGSREGGVGPYPSFAREKRGIKREVRKKEEMEERGRKDAHIW